MSLIKSKSTRVPSHLARTGNLFESAASSGPLGWSLFWLCIAPLLVGVMMYGFARSVVPIPLQEVMTLFGINESRGDWVSLFGQYGFTVLIRDSLPHALWAFALGAFLMLSTQGFTLRTRRSYTVSVYLLIVGMELLVGVFDVIDLLFATVSFWFAVGMIDRRQDGGVTYVRRRLPVQGA